MEGGERKGEYDTEGEERERGEGTEWEGRRIDRNEKFLFQALTMTNKSDQGVERLAGAFYYTMVWR